MNQIIQGDCLEVMKSLPDKSIDLIVTDPPYGLGKKMKGGSWGVTATENKVMLEWDAFIPTKEYFDEMIRISKNQIIWGGNYYGLPPSRCWLAWIKPNFPSASDFELAWTSFDKTSKMFRESRNPDGKRQHPTQKPISLMEWCIEKYSKEGDTILDPFAGSGTTGVACKNLNRNYILIEKEPEYIEIIKKRLGEQKSSAR
jgi:DNA modification methylase